MFNHLPGSKTVKDVLEDKIGEKYTNYLRSYVEVYCDKYFPHVIYAWTSRSGQRDYVWMNRRIIDFFLEKDGMKSSFDFQADRSDNWKCGNRSVPHTTLNPE